MLDDSWSSGAMNSRASPPSKAAMRPGGLLLPWLSAGILRGGGIATYRPGHGAGFDATATAALGGKGSTGPGASFGATASGGYDGAGAIAGGWGPSVEYFSPYMSAANKWAGVDLVVRYAFAGDEIAEGWTLGLAGTWDYWATLGRVRNK
jgi:hypothetical protein